MTAQEPQYRVIDRFPSYRFCEDGTVVSFTRKKPFVMSPIKMGNYVGLQLKTASGVREKQYLHRLIAEAFHGPAEPGMVCRHMDGDSTNNASSNLKWGTYSENNADMVRHGTSPCGERNARSRLTAEKVAAMREIRRASCQSYRSIADMFGVSTMTAFRAVTQQSWRSS